MAWVPFRMRRCTDFSRATQLLQSSGFQDQRTVRTAMKQDQRSEAMSRQKGMLILSVVALSAAGCTNMETQIKSSGALGPVDKDYVSTEYRLAQLDDQAGDLAKTKAADPRVLATATQLKSQAGTLHPGLAAALHAGGIAPPDTPQVSAEVENLRGLNGTAFDHQYVGDELRMHQHAVDVFQRESTETKDNALRTQVQAELPVVKDNLDRLKVLSGDFAQAQNH